MFKPLLEVFLSKYLIQDAPASKDCRDSPHSTYPDVVAPSWHNQTSK